MAYASSGQSLSVHGYFLLIILPLLYAGNSIRCSTCFLPPVNISSKKSPRNHHTDTPDSFFWRTLVINQVFPSIWKSGMVWVLVFCGTNYVVGVGVKTAAELQISKQIVMAVCADKADIHVQSQTGGQILQLAKVAVQVVKDTDAGFHLAQGSGLPPIAEPIPKLAHTDTIPQEGKGTIQRLRIHFDWLHCSSLSGLDCHLSIPEVSRRLFIKFVRDDSPTTIEPF